MNLRRLMMLGLIGGAAWPHPTSFAEMAIYLDARNLSETTDQPVSTWINTGHDTARCPSVTMTGSNRPTIRNMRGEKCLYMARSALQRMAVTFGGAGAITQPFTIWIVAAPEEANTITELLSGAPSSSDNIHCRLITNTWPRGATAVGSGTVTKNGITTPNQPRVYEFHFAGAGSYINVDGATDGTGSTGTPTFTGMTIGAATTPAGGTCLNGRIAAVAVGINMTLDKRMQVRGYLNDAFHCNAPKKSVLMIGDSITVGTGADANDGGFCGDLERWGQTAPGGYYLDFIGPQLRSTYSNSMHYGVAGEDIAYFQTNLAAMIGSGAQYRPDLINLLIGTNDANNTKGAGSYAGAPARYAALLALIRGEEPGIPILVSTLPDSSTGATHTNILDFNSQLPAIWSAEQALGGNLFSWDAFGTLGAWSAGKFVDGLHPNTSGNADLAAAQQAAMLAAFG